MSGLVQSLLLAVWAGLCALDQFGPHLGFRKPLLASVGVGIILGDLQTAIIIGATLELMWLGVNNIGAYVPPDVISGTIVGASIGILSNQDLATSIATAVAVAVPTALLVQQINMLVMTLNISLVHKADKEAEKVNYKGIGLLNWTGGAMFFLSRAVPVFIAVYLGANAIDMILAFIPAKILAGFGVASKVIPAVGLAMLLTMMLKKNMWMFLILGFVLSAYLGLPTLAIALVGAVAAGIYDLIQSKSDNESKMESKIEEGEYDL
ncbi:MAG: PTS sugar transporter subunit IIC [Anaerorhabdus sp.]